MSDSDYEEWSRTDYSNLERKSKRHEPLEAAVREQIEKTIAGFMPCEKEKLVTLLEPNKHLVTEAWKDLKTWAGTQNSRWAQKYNLVCWLERTEVTAEDKQEFCPKKKTKAFRLTALIFIQGAVEHGRILLS